MLGGDRSRSIRSAVVHLFATVCIAAVLAWGPLQAEEWRSRSSLPRVVSVGGNDAPHSANERLGGDGRQRWCKAGEINAGRWEDDDDRISTSQPQPACCGWDKQHFQTNPQVCGTKDMTWDSPGVYSARDDGFLTHGGSRMCSCTRRGRSPPRPMFWVPSMCDLAFWDPMQFCAALGNRTLMFIGDSTVQQAAVTVMNAVMWADGAVARGRCQKQILYGHSDTLVGRPMGGKNRGKLWKTLVAELKPDIVVVSAGAHIFGADDFLGMLKEVWSQYEAMGGTRPHLVWKTQQPAGCTAEPQTQLEPLSPVLQTAGLWDALALCGSSMACSHGHLHASLTANARAARELPYNWGTFRARDALAKEFFRGRAAVLDLEPLYYRSDAHVAPLWDSDCLHMCGNPGGPLRIIPRLMLHMLQIDNQLLPEKAGGPNWAIPIVQQARNSRTDRAPPATRHHDGDGA